MEENELYKIAINEDIDVKEYHLEKGLKGLYSDKLIILKKGMPSAEVKCILAEELGHYYLTNGNIIDQSKIENRKQERLARKWAYNCLIPPDIIMKKIKEGYTELYDLAEALEVTEDFLRDALEEYFLKEKIDINEYKKAP